MNEGEGTYRWRVVADPAIVAYDLEDGRKLIAAPSAAEKDHRLATVLSDAKVGTVGQLRYVSNFPHWGRLTFDTSSRSIASVSA